MSRTRTTPSDSVESAPSATTASRITRSRATPSAKPVASGHTRTGATVRTAAQARPAGKVDTDPITNESPCKPSTVASSATRLTSLKSRAVSQTTSSVPKTTTNGLQSASGAGASRTGRKPANATREASNNVGNEEVDQLAAGMQTALTINGNAKASSSKPKTTMPTANAARQRVASGSTIASNTTNGTAIAARLRTRTGVLVSTTPTPSAGLIGKKPVASRPTSSSDSRTSAVPSQGTGASSLPAFLPSITLICVKPESLDAVPLQQAKENLNKSITTFKSAQAEGYRYERLDTTGPPEAGKGRPADKGKVRESTDATMKAAVDICCVALRHLAAHLLSGVRSGPGWISEALTAIQLRMQIAKACSDFGFVRAIDLSIK
jgi:hypothetical protein